MSEHQEDIADRATTTVVHEKDGERCVFASDTLEGAQRATEEEHGMSLREGIRKYPKAVFWSILFSSALIMEGFDHVFVSGFFAFPAFQERLGGHQNCQYSQQPFDKALTYQNNHLRGEGQKALSNLSIHSSRLTISSIGDSQSKSVSSQSKRWQK